MKSPKITKLQQFFKFCANQSNSCWEISPKMSFFLFLKRIFFLFGLSQRESLFNQQSSERNQRHNLQYISVNTKTSLTSKATWGFQYQMK